MSVAGNLLAHLFGIAERPHYLGVALRGDTPDPALAIVPASWRRELLAQIGRVKMKADLFTLTEQERAVGDLLADAWNRFLELPEQHPHDRDEFMRAIHAAQNIVMARLAYRQQPGAQGMD